MYARGNSPGEHKRRRFCRKSFLISDHFDKWCYPHETDRGFRAWLDWTK